MKVTFDEDLSMLQNQLEDIESERSLLEAEKSELDVRLQDMCGGLTGSGSDMMTHSTPAVRSATSVVGGLHRDFQMFTDSMNFGDLSFGVDEENMVVTGALFTSGAAQATSVEQIKRDDDVTTAASRQGSFTRELSSENDVFDASAATSAGTTIAAGGVSTEHDMPQHMRENSPAHSNSEPAVAKQSEATSWTPESIGDDEESDDKVKNAVKQFAIQQGDFLIAR